MKKGILKRITPDEDESRAVENFRTKTERELTALLREAGLAATAEVHGSVARWTWLASERDVDVFIVISPDQDRSALLKALDVAKAYVGRGWVEAYAEHPYIKAVMNGFDVEFVPCFRTDPREGLLSSTDRTPLHTQFVNQHLLLERRGDVRLLKQFMRGIDVYGAELRVGGFSGYLCELLVIRLGSFEDVLESASAWRRPQMIEDLDRGKADSERKRFTDPLIATDPVDPNRNVASAVSDTSMWTFVAAARAFVKEPAERFFFPKVTKVAATKIKEAIGTRGSSLIFVVMEDDHVDVPDVLWGQLRRAEKAISNHLSKQDFVVIRSAAWSDESLRHILVFELEDVTIPGVTKKAGPPVEMAEDSERFVEAHLDADATVSGPWIEGRRWWVETRRKHRDARQLLGYTLGRGGLEIGVPSGLGEKIAKEIKILVDEEIEDYLQGDFKSFIYRFIRGRPVWLE
jgi:tRNA nucleotidyltransferase (CCA-adding enzyme)